MRYSYERRKQPEVVVFEERRTGWGLLFTFIAVIGVIMVTSPLYYRELGSVAFMFLGVPLVALGLPMAIFMLMKRRVVITESKLEYWRGGKIRFETEWEDVIRVMNADIAAEAIMQVVSDVATVLDEDYWRGERDFTDESGGTEGVVIIRTGHGHLKLKPMTHFRLDTMRKIFMAIIQMSSEYPRIRVEDHAGWTLRRR